MLKSYFSEVCRFVFTYRHSIKKWSKEILILGLVAYLILYILSFRMQILAYWRCVPGAEYIPESDLKLASYALCSFGIIFILYLSAKKSSVMAYMWEKPIRPSYKCLSMIIFGILAYLFLMLAQAYIFQYILGISHISISNLSQALVIHTFSIIILSTSLGGWLINLLCRWFGLGLIKEPIYSATLYQALIYSSYFFVGILGLAMSLEKNNINEQFFEIVNSVLMSFATFATFISAKNGWRRFFQGKK